MSVYSARDLVRVPGLLSLSRLPLAIMFALTVGSVRWSIGVLVLAGASDVLDGWYARRFRQATSTGAALDAVTDKLFVAIVVVTLVVSHGLSVTQALLLGVRDVGEIVIGAGLAAKDGTRLTRPHAPHALGKLTTLLQYAAVAMAIFHSDVVGVLAIAAAVAGGLATGAYWRRERRRPTPRPRESMTTRRITRDRRRARYVPRGRHSASQTTRELRRVGRAPCPSVRCDAWRACPQVNRFDR